MSKIEVNTVEPQCGTTLTLGASGDTVALGSGASQTGFGRTGTVDWITTPKVTGDSPITAVSGNGYFLNTTAGTITVNLPAGAAGSIVSVADYAATWQTNNVTVTPNGAEKIGGTAGNVVLNTEGQSVTLVYVDAAQGWLNTMDSTSNVRSNEFMIATVCGACNTLATAPCCANTKIATFKGPGTFCVSKIAASAPNNLVSYMVVAGGGGGGGSYSGGGGAGGYRELKSPSTPYTASPLDGYPTPGNRITVMATGYPIAVGGAGAAGIHPGAGAGGSGGVSTFSTIPSAGGGGGAAESATGNAGGSGGGGSYPNQPGGAGNTPPVSPAQGFVGGSGGTGAPCKYVSGGGGGALEAGVAGTVPTGSGRGGVGTTTNISGSPTAYAGGGGAGGGTSPTTGGAASPCGTGGAGTNNPGNGLPGTINTGGAGGGGTAGTGGGAGGSGIIILRYKFQ
jgi:hypothetical protein